jgi:plastocyanin
MRNLAHGKRSIMWCLGLSLILGTAALGTILTMPAVAADTEVNIDNFAFTPKELTVKTGATIVFRNRDDIPHSVVGTNGEFRSKALDTDDTFSFTFTKAGTYDYSCGLHPQMQGKVVVTP